MKKKGWMMVLAQSKRMGSETYEVIELAGKMRPVKFRQEWMEEKIVARVLGNYQN